MWRIDHKIASDDGQDRSLDPGAVVGERTVGRDLGAATGNTGTARVGGTTPKDDASGHAGEESTARGDPATSPETACGNPFAKTNNGWWLALQLGKLEKMNLQSDLETLQFAQQQEGRIQKEMTGIAAENEEIGRLLHICGIWSDHSCDSLCGDWRHRSFCRSEKAGRVCGAGSAGA
jgi:hypothetical protein